MIKLKYFYFVMQYLVSVLWTFIKILTEITVLLQYWLYFKRRVVAALTEAVVRYRLGSCDYITQNSVRVSPADELDELLQDNRRVMLQNIADDLRTRLPPDAMLPSETTAHHKVLQYYYSTANKYYSSLGNTTVMSCNRKLCLIKGDTSFIPTRANTGGRKELSIV